MSSSIINQLTSRKIGGKQVAQYLRRQDGGPASCSAFLEAIQSDDNIRLLILSTPVADCEEELSSQASTRSIRARRPSMKVLELQGDDLLEPSIGLPEESAETLPYVPSTSSQRGAILSDWDLYEDNGCIYKLEAVAWVYKDAALLAEKYGEVAVADGLHCINNRRRPVMDICCVGPDGQNIVIFHAILPNEKMATFRWVFFDAFPALLGEKVCKRLSLWVVDCDIWCVTVLESACSSTGPYPNAKLRLCAWHHVTLVMKNMATYLKDSKSLQTLHTAEETAWTLVEAKTAEQYVTRLESLKVLMSLITANEGLSRFQAEAERFLASMAAHSHRLGDFAFYGIPHMDVRVTSRSELIF
jgi:hypothetical protein